MSLGKRLKKLRTEKEISQEKLAEIIGISRSTLSMYELDKREPDVANIVKFADFFGVSTDYLLGRETKLASDPLPVPPEELKELIRLIVKEVTEGYKK
ncbi:MAG TPA: helix-turn-helix transcriptional regulator [Clostridia bacterium]|nr:helix-turn-helix transcriptional regulator [Clostridia bacterium]